MNHVIYNGVDLTTFSLYVSGDKTFNSPEKNYTRVSIPGRSGDLYIWDGTYKNVPLKYDSILIADYEANAANVRNFLLSPNGYVVLEDDYHPEEYRLVVYKGPLEFNSVYLQAGVTTLEFDCKPQRFLKSGAISRQLNSATYTITNPTYCPSKPLFEIAASNSNVTVSCGGHGSPYMGFTVASRDYPVFVDCETMDCYSITDSNEDSDQVGDLQTAGVYQDQNGYIHISPDNPINSYNQSVSKTLRNSLITLTDNDFPTFSSGDVDILSENYSLIKVTPRWYIL